MQLEGGSGSITIDVPDDAPVRLEVQDSGSGNVTTPSGWNQVVTGNDDEGVWEAPDYTGAGRTIDILVVDVGSGSIQIR